MPLHELIQVNGGAELGVQCIGRRTDPAVLLIGGASRSMDWWDLPFCERLAAAASRLVIRYDHRDTGASTWYPPGFPEYTFLSLVDDVIGILDACGLERAHVVGMSMGGQLAQLVALNSPDRVASLTLIATSPQPRADDLSPTCAQLQTHYDTAVAPNWNDRDAVIDYVVAQDRAFAADWSTAEEAVTRVRAAMAVDRSACAEASHTNHYVAPGAAPWRQRLGGLRTPTLVVHGAADPLFAMDHGVALAAEIPGASLLRLPGVGHELPRRCWDTVIPALSRHVTSTPGRENTR